MPLGQRILVEQQLVRPTPDRAAPPAAVLRPLGKVGPVHPCAVLVGDGRILLLHPPLHLGEQTVDQRLARGHGGREPVVLGREVRQHVGVLDLRIAGVAQPGIGVVDDVAVMGGGVGAQRGRGLGGHEVAHARSERTLLAPPLPLQGRWRGAKRRDGGVLRAEAPDGSRSHHPLRQRVPRCHLPRKAGGGA